MENADLLARINRYFGNLSKGQKRLASFILENYDKAAFITAARMGTLVGVSESTVVRFAYALGYDGYPALQRSLQQLIRNRLTAAQRIQLSSEMESDDVLFSVIKSDIANLRYTLDTADAATFKQVIRALYRARVCYVVGMKSAAALAHFFGYYLRFVLPNVQMLTMADDLYESLMRIGPEDLCVGISFPRYSARTVEALEYAKRQGAKVVALTDSRLSPIAELADYVLLAHSDMASFADSLTAPLSLINAILVALSLQNKDETSARFERLEGIWKREHAYVSAKEAQQRKD
jgi:DNA-binding MurR/RpiR family transcriptional regulator